MPSWSLWSILGGGKKLLPPGLKLEGGSLPGEAAKYPGTYRLVVGKLVNGRHAYQHTSDATRWIAFAGDSWMGQSESYLGKKNGFLDLMDPAAASPDVSTMAWKAWNGSAWVEAPQLKCTAWTPPPPGLKLKGGSLPGEAAKYPGTYRLVVGKLVNGRPAYQHTSDATRWIAFAGNGWMGQSESDLGKKQGFFLALTDPAAASPDVSTMTWKAWNGSAWVEAPQLKCTAWTPPPPGLKLKGGSLPGEAAKYPGTYRLVVGKLVNGRPAYQHTSDATRWIAFAGDSWMGQSESYLGKKNGFLDLMDPAAASPDVSTMAWKAWNGSAWVEAPQLKCTAWTPPPPGLKLKGGSLPGEAAKYPGTYRLVVGKLVNGRPAYQHTSDATRWIAFAGNGWMGQSESDLGKKQGFFLALTDPAAASPDVSTMTWKAWNGSAWVEAPQLKCTAWTPPPPGLKLYSIRSAFVLLLPLLGSFAVYSDAMATWLLVALLTLLGVLVGGLNNMITSAVAADLSEHPSIGGSTRSLQKVRVEEKAHRALEEDGFALRPMLVSDASDASVLRSLEALLQTEHPDSLGKGKDVCKKYGPYDSLKLACAWKVDHPRNLDKYTAGVKRVQEEMDLLKKKGKDVDKVPGLPVRTARAAAEGFTMKAGANEAILLHGTSPDRLLELLSTGLNERYSGTNAGTAFGDGIYLAEDVGKTDQYVGADSAYDPSSELHKRLYGRTVRHPGDVFYVLVVRAALGYPVRTQQMGPKATSMDNGAPIFPVNFRELSAVPGVTPPICHHSLIAELGQVIARYREFVLFHSEYVHIDYVIAYHRCNGGQKLSTATHNP